MAAKLNLGFRVGTSSRAVTKWSRPSKPGAGPRYIVIPRDHRVLCIEDTLHRQLRFLEQLGPAVKIVSQAEDAIEALQDESFQWIFLDYDLGLGRTTEEVARYLVSVHFTGFIVIHSTNPFGIAVLEKILREGGISNVETVPFDLLGLLCEK
jgi:CheY-like chemotaxis protein